MDQEIVNSILFKLNQLVDKVVNLEYKVDLLATHLKHKDKQQQTTKKDDEVPISGQNQETFSPSRLLKQMPQKDDQTATDKTWINLTSNYGLALDNIFKVMDVDTLKIMRFVCKTFNMKAVPVLASKTWIDLHTWENNHDSTDEPIPIHDIYELMDSTVGGIVLFKSFSFTYACFASRELEVQVILREFGTNFVSISLDSPINALLKQILELWCINLEELAFVCSDDVSPDDDLVLDDKTFLKLKCLKIIPKRTYIDFSSCAQTLIEIVKHSPQLNSISMGEQTISSGFLRGIIELPDATKNITDLDLYIGDDISNFESLNLNNVINLNIRNKSQWVTSLVRKVASTLVALSLGFPSGSYFEDDDNSDFDDGDHNIFNESDYPELASLSVFKVKGFLPPESSIRNLEFKQKMKNLQVLYINVNQGDLDSILLKSDLYNPVNSLRKLTLIGSISCALSFQILATLFPFALKIKLGLCRKYQSEYTMSDCLKDGLPKFASIESLRAFSLYFDCSLCESIADIIGKLQDFPVLTEFELGNFDNSRAIVIGLLDGIKKIPQQRISFMKLVNIVLNLSEAQRVLDELKTRKIRLEVVENVPLREKM